jgi:hypothetical protein
MAAVIASFASLTRAPNSRRSSGASAPRVFIRPLISPFLPSASTRACSSSGRLAAADTAFSHLSLIGSTFCIANIPKTKKGRHIRAAPQST